MRHCELEKIKKIDSELSVFGGGFVCRGPFGVAIVQEAVGRVSKSLPCSFSLVPTSLSFSQYSLPGIADLYL